MKFKNVTWQLFLAYFLAVLLLLLILIPFAVAIVSSFKTSVDFYGEYTLFPQVWRPQNYIDAIQFEDIFGFMMNSLICAGAVTLIGVIVTSASAYGFARINFLGREILFYIIILTQGIPFAVLCIPLYMMMSKMGLVNSMAGLILPLISFPMGTFILRQSMKVIPMEYEDAASIDGCGRLRMFCSIFLPMTKNSVIAVAIFMFMTSWNNYIWPLVVISDKKLYTLPIGLTLYTAQASMSRRPEWSVILAACMIASIPMLLFYSIASNKFMEGIAMGGIKG